MTSLPTTGPHAAASPNLPPAIVAPNPSEVIVLRSAHLAVARVIADYLAEEPENVVRPGVLRSHFPFLGQETVEREVRQKTGGRREWASGEGCGGVVKGGEKSGLPVVAIVPACIGENTGNDRTSEGADEQGAAKRRRVVRDAGAAPPARVSTGEIPVSPVGWDDKSPFVSARDAKFGLTFDERLADLAAFKQEHGHCRVSEKDNTELGRWVRNIRKHYRKMDRVKRSCLTPQRLAKLVNAGFVFATPRKDPVTLWEERIEGCRKFKEEHGHLNISPHHPELGGFVRHMRGMYKKKMEGEKTALTAERQALLDEMGFVWLAGKRKKPPAPGFKIKTWEERLQEFKYFLETEGHPFVPQHLPGGLGVWVNSQRKAYKRFKRGDKETGTRATILSAEKALILTEAGFAWDASFMFGGGKGPRDEPRSGRDGYGGTVHPETNDADY